MTSVKPYIRSRYNKPAGKLTGKYTRCLETKFQKRLVLYIYLKLPSGLLILPDEGPAKRIETSHLLTVKDL